MHMHFSNISVDIILDLSTVTTLTSKLKWANKCIVVISKLNKIKSQNNSEKKSLENKLMHILFPEILNYTPKGPYPLKVWHLLCSKNDRQNYSIGNQVVLTWLQISSHFFKPIVDTIL